MTIRRTPLYEAHRDAGARLTPFGGWDMPLQYGGATEEHHLVRRACGLFDVSHMGEIVLEGSGAIDLVQELTVNDVRRLGDGDAQYSVLCDDAGKVIDDLIVYRVTPDRMLLIVNAGTTAGDLDWIRSHAGRRVVIDDQSEGTGLIAVQGPRASEVLGLVGVALVSQRPFTMRAAELAGVPVTVSRTGYTGEDGVEVMVSAAQTRRVWDALLEASRAVGGGPCGLAARDTLRLEAGLPLYGSDMDRTTTALEASLGWVIKLDKGPFIGRDALRAEAATGASRCLVGIAFDEAVGVPRHGFPVTCGGRTVGAVTSGTKSPTLGQVIAMAYVEPAARAPSTAVAVDVRGRSMPGRVVRRPFYRRQHA